MSFKYISNWGIIVFPDGKICKSIGNQEYKHQVCRIGYHRVQFTVNDKRVSRSVHRLVAMCFVPNPDNKPDVNHIDANKSNNHYTNLEWVTKKENIRHMRAMGLYRKKSQTFWKDERNEVIKELVKIKVDRSELARIFKISIGRVAKIIKQGPGNKTGSIMCLPIEKEPGGGE